MNRQPRIFHVISNLDCYGAAHSLRLLVEGEQTGARDVHVVALAGGPQACEELARQGVHCEVLRRRWPFDPVVAGRLASRLRAAAPDIVHVWDLASLTHVCLAGLARLTCPLVATLPKVPQPGSFSAGLLLSVHVDRFIAGSQTLQQKFLRLGIQQPVQIVPPGVLPATAADSLQRKQWLAELQIAPESRLIAMAGPLVKNEAMEDAIWNFELVRTLHPEARLLIVGEGPNRHRLERFARLASDAQSVLFLGNRPDVAEILQHADVFWQHVPAAALLEAMAAGVPVVAADCLAHREFIEEGRCGFLAPSDSRADWGRTTDRLLSDVKLAQRLGSAGAQRVQERFSAESMIRSYGELYPLKGKR